MDLMIEHVKSKPEPPSARTEIPVRPELERVVFSCLEKQPDDRPQSALELSDMLSAIDFSEAWTAARAREWWELHLPKEAGSRAGA
jgi:serine/threonine-protein kinase